MNRVEIQPIDAKSDEPFFAWGEWMSPVEEFSRSLGHPQMEDREGTLRLPADIADSQLDRYERGWWFGAGDPEFWKYQDLLLVPGGKLLDLGLSAGRCAIPFAMRGMNVVGYDNNSDALAAINAIVGAYDFLPIEVREEDMLSSALGKDEYDTVVLGQVLGHLSSVDEAHLLIDKAVDALKPGGHIWIRTIGKEDEKYEEFQYSWEVEQIDDNLFVESASHAHSGHGHQAHGNGHFLFFGPTDLMVYLASRGLHLVHSQILPDEGQMNIMFGDDWKKDRVFGRSGMITLIAQKKSA